MSRPKASKAETIENRGQLCGDLSVISDACSLFSQRLTESMEKCIGELDAKEEMLVYQAVTGFHEAAEHLTDVSEVIHNSTRDEG